MPHMRDDHAQSRRTLLRLASGLGAASLIAATSGRALAAKASKASVGYQETPKGDHDCANCALFSAPNQCKSVDGDVSSTGWCKIWVAKKAA